MDAVILAGGTPSPNDYLYSYTQGSYKSLVDIQGKPMVQWVLDALEVSKIEDVIVIGLPNDTPLRFNRSLIRLPDTGGIISNIRSGAAEVLRRKGDPQACIMTVSSDIPGITPAMVNWSMEQFQQGDYDIHYSIVARQVMEKRFPGSRRTYLHLRDGEVCGGDLNAVRIGKALENLPIFDQLSANRKNALKQASMIGFDILFLLLTRQLSLKDAERRISQRLKVKGHLLVSPYAEIAMDVDKPFQLEIMRQDLAGHP